MNDMPQSRYYNPPKTEQECLWELAVCREELQIIREQIRDYDLGEGPERVKGWRYRAGKASHFRAFKIECLTRKLKEIRGPLAMGQENQRLIERLAVVKEQLRHCQAMIEAYAPDRIDQMQADLAQLEDGLKDASAAKAA